MVTGDGRAPTRVAAIERRVAARRSLSCIFGRQVVMRGLEVIVMEREFLWLFVFVRLNLLERWVEEKG